MHVIGITGSIGMGKTYVTSLISDKNIPKFDSDIEVKNIYCDEAIQNKIKEKLGLKEISSNIITSKIRENDNNLVILEEIVHPLVEKKLKNFLREYSDKDTFVVMEVPLLFEKNYDKYCDTIIVVSASRETQIKRLLSRESMTNDKIRFFEKLQLPDYIKKSMADYIINSELPKDQIIAQIDYIIDQCKI